MQIGAADSARSDLDEELVGLRGRIRNPLDRERLPDPASGLDDGPS